MEDYKKFEGVMPEKILNHFYEFKFIEKGHGNQVWLVKIFWNGFKWNIYNPKRVDGAELFPDNFWDNKQQVYWKEFKVPN